MVRVTRQAALAQRMRRLWAVRWLCLTASRGCEFLCGLEASESTGGMAVPTVAFVRLQTTANQHVGDGGPDGRRLEPTPAVAEAGRLPKG
jgi:hypothetical protein